MTAIASSSTSKAFPFSQGINNFDEFISDLPHFYGTSTTTGTELGSRSRAPATFKTIDTYLKDPEFFMGDDCDTYYQDTLLNSDLLQYLESDIDGFTKTNKDLNVNELFASTPQIAHQRLEMLLSHMKFSIQQEKEQLFRDTTTTATIESKIRDIKVKDRIEN